LVKPHHPRSRIKGIDRAFLFISLSIGFFAIPLPSAMSTDIPRETLKEKVSLEMKVGKERIYLHEKILLTVKLSIRSNSLKDIQFPQLTHPDFSVQEFQDPVQKGELRDGIPYETMEFKTTLFGKKAGQFVLGPSRLHCILLVPKSDKRTPSPGASNADEYFGSPEAYPLSLDSNEISLKVLPLPDIGRPEGFRGAVGNFKINVEVSPRELEIGEPITLKITIGGEGNIETVTLPLLENRTGFKFHDPQFEDKAGKRIFELALLPESDRSEEVPAIHFAFFDPETERYQTLHSGPFPIKVRKVEKGEAQNDLEFTARPILPLKRTPGRLKKEGEFLYQNKSVWLLHLFSFFLFVALWTWNRRKEKTRNDPDYSRLLEAKRQANRGLREVEKGLKQGKITGSYDAVFKTLQQYLGNKFNLPIKSITLDGAEGTLVSARVNEEDLSTLRHLFFRCDQVRYASLTPDRKEAEETLRMLKEVLTHLEGKRL
jgi:hypothetical protein